MRRLLLAGLVLLLISAGLIAGSLYVVTLITSDGLELQEGDFAYWLLANDMVSNWPHEQPVKITYYARDGTSPEQISITHPSRFGRLELKQRYRKHCSQQGYDLVPPDEQLVRSAIVSCEAEGYRIIVSVSDTVEQSAFIGQSVTVVFVEQEHFRP